MFLVKILILMHAYEYFSLNILVVFQSSSSQTTFKMPPSPAELLRSNPIYQFAPTSNSADVNFTLPSSSLSNVLPRSHSQSSFVFTAPEKMPSTSRNMYEFDSTLSLSASVNLSRAPVISFDSGPASLPVLNSASFAALNKNPISALMEYAQARKTTATIDVVSERGPPHKPV